MSEVNAVSQDLEKAPGLGILRDRPFCPANSWLISLAFLACCVTPDSSWNNMSSDQLIRSELRVGWTHVSLGALSFEVPEDFRVADVGNQNYPSGIDPPNPTVVAINPEQQLFVYAIINDVNFQENPTQSQISGYDRFLLEQVANALVVPRVGHFYCDKQNDQTCHPERMNITAYRSIGAMSREVTLTLAETRNTFRVYFVSGFEQTKGRFSRSRWKYMVVGCPEQRADDYNQLMSTIISTFEIKDSS